MTNPYILAHYHVDIFLSPILIGQISEELESYLKRENASTWAFITASNPMSEVLSHEENERRNLDLQAKIGEYHYLKAEGRDPSGEWTPEKSFLILDISREKAIGIAAEFKQKAIVFGEKGGESELVMIDK